MEKPRQPFIYCLFVSLAWTACSVVWAQDPGTAAKAPLVIGSIGELWELPEEEAQQGHSVGLDVVVLYCDPKWKILFGRDETGTTYFEISDTQEYVAAGKRIRVQGVTQSSEHGQKMRVQNIQFLGQARLPQPVEEFKRIENLGAHVNDFMKASGLVRDHELVDGRLRIVVRTMNDHLVQAIVRDFEGFKLERLSRARVSVKGVCALNTASDSNPGYTLFVQDIKFMTIFENKFTKLFDIGVLPPNNSPSL